MFIFEIYCFWQIQFFVTKIKVRYKQKYITSNIDFKNGTIKEDKLALTHFSTSSTYFETF